MFNKKKKKIQELNRKIQILRFTNEISNTLIKELIDEVERAHKKDDLQKLSDGRRQVKPVQKRYATKLSLDL